MNKYFNTDVFLKNVKQKAYPQSGIINESERKISLFGIMEILTAMPIPDVVEVVRCKYCKWHGYLTCSNPEGVKGWVTDNDYCSYGERREDDKRRSEEAIEELKCAIDLIKQDGKDWLDERDIPLLQMAIEALEADVKPVVRGENLGGGAFLCSACGFNDVAHSHTVKFCPNCGAEIINARPADEDDSGLQK